MTVRLKNPFHPFPIRLLLIAWIAIGTPMVSLSAQDEAPPTDAPQLLDVFLDCHLITSCDTDHFRREITFVNWVRVREDAHVHLILTYTPSGAGNEYQFDNIGLGRFQGEDSHISWISSNVNTRDEILEGITRTMALGFVPFAQQLGLAEQLRVEFDPPDAIQNARQ